MRKFCITGAPGVGKSTVIEELNKRGIKAFDADAVDGLCQWKNETLSENVEYHPGIGKDWLDKNNYICDVAKLKEIIDKHDGVVVVAGVVSNQEEFLKLFDKVFLLRCDEEVFLHRLNTRDANDFGKDKSDQDHILGWYKDFEANMINYGAIPIDTNVPLKNVVDKIISEIQEK